MTLQVRQMKIYKWHLKRGDVKWYWDKYKMEVDTKTQKSYYMDFNNFRAFLNEYNRTREVRLI